MKTKNIFFETMIIIMVSVFLAITFLFAETMVKGVVSTPASKIVAALFLGVLFWRYAGGLIKIFLKKLSFRTAAFLGIIVLMIIILSSCATKASYTAANGKLTNLQRHRISNYVAVQRMQRIEDVESKYNELNFRRLENQSVIADSLKGYMGKIMNLTRWQNIQFKIFRIEASGKIGRLVISETLAPGQQSTKHLLPGRYFYQVFVNHRLTDQGDKLNVSSELVGIFGESMHWYLYRDEK